MEEPVIRASLSRSVVIGPDLKGRLEDIARARGCDSSYLARTILRRFVDAAECAARAESGDE
jgi:predicted transcriptional regulator